MIVLYTDGSCRPDRCGGWGYHYILGGFKKKGSGGVRDTTVNRMELTAIIEGLEALAREGQSGGTVLVTSDSKYAVDGASKWLQTWKRYKWMTASNEPVKNQDLWEKVDALSCKFTVRWKWVRGHTGIDGNEYADRLASRAAFLASAS